MRTVFPQSDQFPLGRPYGAVPGEPEPASAARPFGLAATARRVRPDNVARLDPGDLGYDDEAQIGLIRDGEQMVPLAKHTNGQTKTVTHNDGHGGNDSDSDYRED
jgi:putative ATP-grasp target RiPP